MAKLTLDQAGQAFTADPGTFLRKNIVTIASGGSKAKAGVNVFLMSDNTHHDKGFTTGLSGKLGKTKDRQAWRVTWVRLGSDPVNPGEFAAHYVPMVQTSQPSHVIMPGASVSPVDLMVTSQLTGCAFGVGSKSDGTVLVTHIQPNQGIKDAGDRADDLNEAMNTSLAKLNVKFVHGRDDDGYSGSSTVVGKRVNNEWVFYLQDHGTCQYTYQSDNGKAKGTGKLLERVQVMD